MMSLRLLACAGVVASAPNIVVFLTDDQDVMLGGAFPTLGDATPMPRTRELLVERGATFTGMMVHTPICSPSRAELLTGRLLHNLKTTGGTLWQMHLDEERVHNYTFAARMKAAAGYRTGLFGKYLNAMPAAAPRASWDAWLANGGGSYVAPSFDAAGVAAFGFADGPWQGTAAPENYSTAVIGNLSLAWLEAGLVAVARGGAPSLAYIAPKAPHEPFLPAPWYAEHWDPSWPEREPRPPVWNASAALRAKHHGVVADQPLLSDAAAAVITRIFKNRWRSLMSVDDVVAAVVGAVDAAGQADSTFFFFTSDHGFQLGEFNFVMDKRHPYDWVTRVPLVVAGPGVRAGVTVDLPVMMTDIAPTLVELAGLDAADWGASALPSPDGTSLVPLLRAAGDARALAATAWRTENFIEYYFVDDNAKCVENCSLAGEWPTADACCADLSTTPNGACWGTEQDTGVKPATDQECDVDCYPTEDERNNFIGLRRADLLYVEYQTGDQGVANVSFEKPDFFELFNASNDPWLTTNIYGDVLDLQPDVIAELHESAQRWFGCSTTQCP